MTLNQASPVWESIFRLKNGLWSRWFRMEVKRVCVLGAGLMGHGIAQVCAQTGKFEVSMRDIEQRFVDNGMKMIKDSLQRFVKKGTITEAESKEILNRIHPTLDLKQAVQNADLVIEAVTENPPLKKAVLAEADKYAPPHAIIAVEHVLDQHYRDRGGHDKG